MPPNGAHKRAVNRRRKPVAHDGHEGGDERWLVTYADMLTLLLVLFIVLFSISVVNTSKFISLKTSLAAAFGTSGNGHSILTGGTGLMDNTNPGVGNQLVMSGLPVTQKSTTDDSKSDQFPKPTVRNGYTEQDVTHEVADYRKIQKSVTDALNAKGMGSAVRFRITSRGLIITVVTNQLVFPGNSADLLGRGQEILKVIAPPLTNDPRGVEVDGFTNQAKVSTYPYPSGWELSAARAAAVVRYLSAHGVKESRLTAVGYSDQHPLYPRSDPRAYTLNRRVEIVVLSSLPAAAGSELATAGVQH